MIVDLCFEIALLLSLAITNPDGNFDLQLRLVHLLFSAEFATYSDDGSIIIYSVWLSSSSQSSPLS